MMMLNVAVLVPPFIEERNKNSEWIGDYKVNNFDTSLILSIFFVAQIVFAPINASIKNSLGSKNTILIGFILMTLTTFGMGMIANFNDANAFKYTALVLRFLQG